MLERGQASIVGWDIGGAHVKACLLQDGAVQDIAQWPCALWQGLERLLSVLAEARARWPALARAQHAVTMSGEMADLFADREDGVRAIAGALAATLGERLRLYAGDQGWCSADDAPSAWSAIASANWLAAARLAALRLGDGVLVDIGSTTTDLIAFAAGRVLCAERSDAERLASGTLVYHGVVRTPLCALARRIAFRGRRYNVMNELFATSADVYRLTGELAPSHDQHPSADGAPKSADATRRRIARMIGHDARDASDGAWLEFAQAWRDEQVREIAGQLDRVLARHALPAGAPLVAAGCGDFLVAGVAAASSAASTRPFATYAASVCGLVPGSERAGWAQVGAPSVAVAMLHRLDKESSRCGS